MGIRCTQVYGLSKSSLELIATNDKSLDAHRKNSLTAGSVITRCSPRLKKKSFDDCAVATRSLRMRVHYDYFLRHTLLRRRPTLDNQRRTRRKCRHIRT